MSEVTLTVRTFRMGTEKEASLKPLEEAAEVYASWQEFYTVQQAIITAKKASSLQDELHDKRDALTDEIADCIQACVNLADRYNLDLQAAMERCEERNRERGRYE